MLADIALWYGIVCEILYCFFLTWYKSMMDKGKKPPMDIKVAIASMIVFPMWPLVLLGLIVGKLRK